MHETVIPRKLTPKVLVGDVPVGGNAPVVVQSMTNTDTADIEATTRQVIELSEAGSEIVRITVNTDTADCVRPGTPYRWWAIFIITAIPYCKISMTVRMPWINTGSTRETWARVKNEISDFAK